MIQAGSRQTQIVISLAVMDVKRSTQLSFDYITTEKCKNEVRMIFS